MKRNIRFFILVIILVVAYGGFIVFWENNQVVGASPVITVPSTVLTLSVEDDEEELLKNITASDEEDGSLTDKVYIESISTFDANQQRTVTYAVFDSDDNLTRATRLIEYSDYEAPVFNIEKALCIYFVTSTEEYKDYVSAYSVLDGDISSAITVQTVTTDGYDLESVTYSVTDSTGTKTTQTFDITPIDSDATIDIELTDYYITVDLGTTIYPREYIDTISENGVENSSLIYSLDVTDNYEAYTPGTYEFIYRIDRSNSYGLTKLIVVVEE